MPEQQLQFDERALVALYSLQKYDALSAQLLEGIQGFGKATYLSVNTAEQHQINSFAHIFLFLFSQPDYHIADQFVVPFVFMNPVISNLAAVSEFKTTDAFLARVLHQKTPNFAKVLALYSARNKTENRPPHRVLFDGHAKLASIWYSLYGHAYRGWQIDPQVSDNLRRHYTEPDARLECMMHDLSEVYFGSTYIDGVCDRPIKERVNAWIQATAPIKAINEVAA